MHVRRNINLLLQRSHYQIVKVFAPGESDAMPPEVLLDDQVLGSRIALERKHAWIVAAPKSGSTWLSALLEDLLGWRAVGLSGGSCRREQEPDLRQIIRFPTENILSPHQHCRASDCTVQFIKRFRIKSILQVRNIYDTIISFRDHCRTEGLVFPMAYIDREFLRLSDEQQFQFIIDLVLPWYFNFYASWFEVEGLGPDNLFYVTYEDLRQDPRPVLNQILDYLGESRTPTEIDMAIQRTQGVNTRKNKAVIGRGNALLTDRHKDRIRELRQYYSHIDFSMVGL